MKGQTYNWFLNTHSNDANWLLETSIIACLILCVDNVYRVSQMCIDNFTGTQNISFRDKSFKSAFAGCKSRSFQAIYQKATLKT